jgi:hypothetical protein
MAGGPFGLQPTFAPNLQQDSIFGVPRVLGPAGGAGLGPIGGFGFNRSAPSEGLGDPTSATRNIFEGVATGGAQLVPQLTTEFRNPFDPIGKIDLFGRDLFSTARQARGARTGIARPGQAVPQGAVPITGGAPNPAGTQFTFPAGFDTGLGGGTAFNLLDRIAGFGRPELKQAASQLPAIGGAFSEASKNLARAEGTPGFAGRQFGGDQAILGGAEDPNFQGTQDLLQLAFQNLTQRLANQFLL